MRLVLSVCSDKKEYPMTRIIMNTAKGIVMPRSIMGDLGIPPRLVRLLIVVRGGESKEIVVIVPSLSLLLLLAKGSDVPSEDEPNKPSPCCRLCMPGK